MEKHEKITIPNYSLSEEIINAITHGVASCLSVWGLVMLIIKASSKGSLAVVAVTLFGASMIILYLISCIYHSLSKKLRGKKVLRVIDHCNVFLLVYGTIIPVSLLGIGGEFGWLCFGFSTLITLIGILSSCINLDRMKCFEVGCHLLNGWGVLLYIDTLIGNIGLMGVLLLISGGIVYTIGAILYGIGSRKKYFHSVFHFLCMIGTFLHYLTIYFYIL